LGDNADDLSSGKYRPDIKKLLDSKVFLL